jgi:hypothetical protein
MLPVDPSTIVPDFLALLLQNECPSDVFACANLPIPDAPQQVTIVETFHHIQDNFPLHGADELVWKLLYRQREDDLQTLLIQLQIFDTIMHDVTEMRTSV